VGILGDGVNIKMVLNAVVKTRASRYLGYGYGYEYGYGATNSKRPDLK
jgi:hypothetical protein